jgi:hypothetical protein
MILPYSLLQCHLPASNFAGSASDDRDIRQRFWSALHSKRNSYRAYNKWSFRALAIHRSGGSRIKLKGESRLRECKIDQDDDNYWKFGLIYFNPQDPIIFLERRYGIGWTINFGNIKAVLILIGTLITLITGLAIINHL